MTAALATEPTAEAFAPFVPDPAAVTRHESGWRFPQAGWHVVHIEGTPYERGIQHGRLLAREIVDQCQTIAKIRSPQAPDKSWRDLRLFVNALFLRRFDPEYLREMQGIADGAAGAGAKLDGRPLDLIDIVVINADIEVGFLEAALKGTATGIDGIRFHGRHGATPRAPRRERCSAFVATGSATVDGKIVLGHITMSDLPNVRFFNVWLDILPSEGHRMVFQTFPGGIQSGMDYYINSAGLIVTETTIEQTKFNPQGEMLASRIRRAVQYSDSIDQCLQTLKSSNSGLYTNEWLFGDLKTNEIAMFELGTETTRLWRSSRDEWVGATKGFYWGCNNVKDVGIFKETVADFGAKPANLVLYPRLRDEAWLKLFGQYRGRIDESFGFAAFSTPPLVAFPSCDAKFTTAAMAKGLKTWAKFGPPLGRTWLPSESDREELSSVQPLVAHDWTIIDVQQVQLPPANLVSETKQHVVDLEPFPKKEEAFQMEFDAIHPFAWRGTLLPETDADVWLAAAFSEFEKVVSLEQALHRDEELSESHQSRFLDELHDESDEPDKTTAKRKQDDLSRDGRDLLDLALFQHESAWLTAARRMGRDIPLTETQSDLAHSDWYRIAAGKGVMLLNGLKQQLGTESFIHCLDEFGVAHAGQAVTTDQFRQHLSKTTNADAVATLDRWLKSEIHTDFAATHRPLDAAQAADRTSVRHANLKPEEFKSLNPWTIFSHEVEPDRVLIVYGTLQDRDAQREAALHLQIEVGRRFANLSPPLKSDLEVTDAELASHHVLLIGRPATNRMTVQCSEKKTTFPVQFGSQSFRIGDQTFAHPESYVIAAGENPWNGRYSVVVFAGLNANSTWKSVRNLPDAKEPNAQVILEVLGKRTRSFRVRVSD